MTAKEKKEYNSLTEEEKKIYNSLKLYFPATKHISAMDAALQGGVKFQFYPI